MKKLYFGNLLGNPEYTIKNYKVIKMNASQGRD